MFRTAPLDPGKAIRGIGREDLSILDFWRWGYSNLLPNITRGVFAEYLVAVALGKDGQPRKPWAGSDVKYKDKKVEVKSTSFVQSWGETRGEPVFVVAKHGEWSDRSELEKEKKYRGDVYVLCCLKEDADEDTIMDVSRWEFWALARDALVKPDKHETRIRVKTLRKERPSMGFGDLPGAVDDIILSLDPRGMA